MKGTHLGELEELILLIVANLSSEAYGLAIKKYVNDECGRSVSLSTIHSTIHRLEDKGFLKSKYDKTSDSSRGGRPKLVFSITSSGTSAIKSSMELRSNLWKGIPSITNG